MGKKWYIIKIYLVILVTVFMLSALKGRVVYAALASVNYGQIQPNGNWNEFTIYESSYATCMVDIPQNGRVSIDVQVYSDSYQDMFLKDEDGKDMAPTHTFYAQGIAKPNNYNYTFDMLKGKYYVSIQSGEKSTGKVRIKVTNTPAITGETEPNNIYTDATPLTLGVKMTGFLTNRRTNTFHMFPETQDFIDYYKIVLPSEGYYDILSMRLNPDPENRKTTYEYTVFNGDMIKQFTKDYTSSTTQKLKAGTYYILVESKNCLFGPYELLVRQHTEHDWGVWQTEKAATVDKSGLKKRECKLCNAEEMQIIPATGKGKNPVKTETNSVKLNRTSITIKRNKSNKNVRVTDYMSGDYIKSIKVINKKLLTAKKKGKYGLNIKAKKKTGTTRIKIMMKSKKVLYLKVKVKR